MTNLEKIQNSCLAWAQIPAHTHTHTHTQLANEANEETIPSLHPQKSAACKCLELKPKAKENIKNNLNKLQWLRTEGLIKESWASNLALADNF